MPKYSTMGLMITVLSDANRPLSTQQIAKFAGISWKTARDNLEALFDAGMVERGRVGKNKRIYWRTDEEIIDKSSIKKHKEVEKRLKIKD